MKSKNNRIPPQNLEKELLKSDKIVTISNIISLALCSLGLGTVLVAMGLDQFEANIEYQKLLDMTAAGVSVGGAGVVSTFITGLFEQRHEKLKRRVEKERIIKDAAKEVDEELKEAQAEN